MNETKLDCRGMTCPQPVVVTKKRLDAMETGTFTTIVDNEIAKENVSQFVRNAGCSCSIAEQGNDYYITITKNKDMIPKNQNNLTPNLCIQTMVEDKMVYCIASNSFGQGSPDLGLTLMKSFFTTLCETSPPKTLIFLNSGVYLSCEGSMVLEKLLDLQQKGTAILSCGTCLDYYKLKEKLAVGTVSNMLEIVNHLSGPQKAIVIS